MGNKLQSVKEGFENSYEIQGPAIGKGELGQTFKCISKQSGRPFAVKILDYAKFKTDNGVGEVEVKMLR